MSMHELGDRLQSSLGDGFTIVRELGGGGMSRVFLAHDDTLGRSVVVKVLPEELAEAVSAQRFRREILLAATLHHPHIVPLLSAGEVDGIPYYVMPYVEGESLRHRLARGPMPPAAAARIMREVASALEYAHARDIVHRDIKPDNVLLTGDIAAVIDFGVAKAVSQSRTSSTDTTNITSFGLALGTPMYMAPEQAAADPSLDHRADIYALGGLIYELLTGQPPFADVAAHRLLSAHMTTTPVPLSERRPGVPPALAALVMRCLAKAPEERPQNAKEIIQELDRIMSSGAYAARGTVGRRIRLARSVVIAAGLAIVMAVSAVAVHSRTSASTARSARDRSVGVVPFANLTADNGDEYFSDGVTQEIADALARVPSLRVAAVTRENSARNTGMDAKKLGAALGVRTILQGSIQRASGHIRITARLIDAESGFQLWSEKYDRDVKDVFALQDEIARAVATGLQVRLGADSLVRTATSDPEAYRLYLQGMYFWNRRGAEIRRAIQYFQQAIVADPTFAKPYAGLALSYAVLVSYEDVDVHPVLDSAVRAANEALKRNSASADAYTAIGQAKEQLWENDEATKAFEQALALDPNSARAHHWYAEHLAHLGRFDDALRHIHRAQELEPLTIIINANVGRIELEARHFRKAEAALKHTLEMDSTQRTARSLLGATYLQEGRPAEAIAEFQRSLTFGSKQTGTRLMLANAYAVTGARGQAKVILDEVRALRESGQPVSFGGLALVYDALGQRDQAIRMLDSAVLAFDPVIEMHSREAIFDPLRRDARGRAILARSER